MRDHPRRLAARPPPLLHMGDRHSAPPLGQQGRGMPSPGRVSPSRGVTRPAMRAARPRQQLAVPQPLPTVVLGGITGASTTAVGALRQPARRAAPPLQPLQQRPAAASSGNYRTQIVHVACTVSHARYRMHGIGISAEWRCYFCRAGRLEPKLGLRPCGGQPASRAGAELRAGAPS